MKLLDLGERRIVDELLRPRYESSSPGHRFGDDCASALDISARDQGTVVATTDPCPEPMAALLGYGRLYYRGWLLSTINYSDLAAAGAAPLGLLTSLSLPSDMEVSDFQDLLDGIDDSARANASRVLGGNLRESRTVDLSATALGWCPSGKQLSRRGAAVGDRLLVIGSIGFFWLGVFAHIDQVDLPTEISERAKESILTPRTQLAIMHALADQHLVNCCIDNSDGLYPSLKQLADANQLMAFVDFDGAAWNPLVIQGAKELGIEVARLAMGWGDWNVLAAVSPCRVDEVRQIATQHNTDILDLGEFLPGSGVHARYNREAASLATFESERLTQSSWFTSGIDAYTSMLRSRSIINL